MYLPIHQGEIDIIQRLYTQEGFANAFHVHDFVVCLGHNLPRYFPVSSVSFSFLRALFSDIEETLHAYGKQG